MPQQSSATGRRPECTPPSRDGASFSPISGSTSRGGWRCPPYEVGARTMDTNITSRIHGRRPTGSASGCWGDPPPDLVDKHCDTSGWCNWRRTECMKHKRSVKTLRSARRSLVTESLTGVGDAARKPLKEKSPEARWCALSCLIFSSTCDATPATAFTARYSREFITSSPTASCKPRLSSYQASPQLLALPDPTIRGQRTLALHDVPCTGGDITCILESHRR